MDNQEFDYYLNEFQLRRNARRWWAKAIVTCAILGGIYGATVGVTVGAVPGAATIIEIAAAIFAFLCSGPGAWYGSIFGMINRIRFGRYFVGMAAAILGAIVGGVLATMLLMAFGAISGAVIGWFVARAVVGAALRRDSWAGLQAWSWGRSLASCCGRSISISQRPWLASFGAWESGPSSGRYCS